MCSPQVMAIVRAEMSRRRMLGVATAASVAAPLHQAPRPCAGCHADRTRRPAASPVPLAGFGPFTQIQDLSHTHGPDFPMYPGAQQMQMDVIVTIAENGFFKYQLTLDEHTGTHMDAPAALRRRRGVGRRTCRSSSSSRRSAWSTSATAPRATPTVS